MAKLTGLEQARRKRRLKVGTRRLLFFFGTIAAVIGVIVGVNAMWNSVFVEKVGREIASLGSGDGYPVVTEGKAVRDIYSFGPDVAVVTDTSLQVYNKSAKLMQDSQHNLSNPIAEFSEVRILMYEPNGKSISVYNCSKKLDEKKFNNPITAATISDSGVYAVATQGDRDASVVYVYNKASDLLFTWYSEERVSDIAVSPDGRSVAASTLVTQDGVLVTKTYFFNTSSKKQVSQCEFMDELALEIAYKDNDEIFMITDTAAHTVSLKGDIKNTYSYGGKEISGCSLEKRESPVLMLGDYENFRKTTLVVLDGECAEKSVIDIDADITDFKGGEKISVLTEYGVYEYSYEGELISSAKLTSGRSIAGKKGYVYINTPNGIEKIAAQNGDVISVKSSD